MAEPARTGTVALEERSRPRPAETTPGAGPREVPGRPRPDALGAAFARLDAMLARTLDRIGGSTTGVGGGNGRQPDAEGGDPSPRRLRPSWAEVVAEHPGWRWLREDVGLGDLELDLVLVVLAPEADLRYERLYSCLPDDGRARPVPVDVALELATTSVADKVAARALFAADAPLLGRSVLRLERDSGPLLAAGLLLDEQVADVLLGAGGLDRELAACCRLARPAPGGWSGSALPGHLRAALLGAAAGGSPMRLHFRGPAGSGRSSAAAALAGELGVPLLSLDLALLPAAVDEADRVLVRAFRESALHGALLCVENLDEVAPDDRRHAALVRRLDAHPGTVVLTGDRAWAPASGPPVGIAEVSFGHPDAAVRRWLWREALSAADVDAPDELVEALAGRFRFGPRHVRTAVANATAAAALGPDGAGARPAGPELLAAARRLTGHRLDTLARRVEPACGWADLVLPAAASTQLRELCRRVTLGARVWQEWGFDRTAPHGHGTTALFTGPPGTGKTMAGEVIAAELALDLYTIDLSTVISKYIGETEKNLERVFTAATDADVVLLFDEADALFGKRSEVHDAHDRYANVETAYLLQRMESYDGIAILATNLRGHLDDAFTRRLQFIVDFPFPAEAERLRIWRLALPASAPVADDVDLDRLAREIRFTGGNIRNAVLHAAFLAAADDAPIGMAHLLVGVRRESLKMGRVVTGPDIGAE